MFSFPPEKGLVTAERDDGLVEKSHGVTPGVGTTLRSLEEHAAPRIGLE